MKNLFDYLMQGRELSPGLATLAAVVWIFLVTGIVLAFMSTFAGVGSWAERRIAGRMMSRIGPNRVGPQGFLQWIVDGIKCWLKEDVIPDAVDKPLFRFAPYLVFAGTFAAFAALPFGFGIAASRIDVGILYVSAIASLVVIGILMAGWASDNKWSLLGGIRSTAQIVSYEIPAGLCILSVVMLAGTLDMQTIIERQGGWPWQWFAFHNPFAFVACFIFSTSVMAEGNRTPFDLPEAESELVAGYLTEYSGMRFVFFLFGEWANLWVMSAIVATLFLGGWQIPGVDIASAGESALPFLVALSVAVFFAKTLSLVFVVMWLRWTLPRLRVDQLMIMCWKYFVPISLACLVGSALFLLLPQGGAWKWFHLGTRIALAAVGFGMVAGLFWRALYNIRAFQDKIYLGLE